MCGRMIFPTIAKNLGILSGHGENFSPDESDTIRGIFKEKLENLGRGLSLLKDLTSGASGTITPETTITELKRMIMESSCRYVGELLDIPPEKVAETCIAFSA